MMQLQHSYLNHLQLDRIIGAGLDTMGVIPDTVMFYIDAPNIDTNICIDCGLFNVDSTKFVTQRVLKFFGSSLSKILFLDATNNRYFFSFSSIDSSGHAGVLHGNDTVYNSPTHPYQGFFEGQQYRLSVDYNVTGNFNLPRNWSGAVALDAIRKQSDIENRMWLSGDSLPSFAWNQFYKNPANLIELDTAGWYFPPDTTNGDTIVNQNFANRYMFNCENLDGLHYFYAHIYDVKSEAGYVDDCIFKIQTSVHTNVAARIIDPYPFEYHPSNIQPRSYTFTIPTGYHAAGAFLTNEIIGGGISFRNQTTSLTVDTTQTFTYYDSLFQNENCLVEGDTTTGTKLYYGDIQTFRSLEILVESDNCDTTGFRIDSTTAVVSFEGDVEHCLDVNNVSLGFVDSLKSLQGTILYNIRPNDQISFNQSIDAQSNRICFSFSIQNPLDTFPDDSTFSTFAPNYFVVIPDTTTLNWLSNWTYHSSNTISYPTNNQFFLSDTLLGINETHIGDSICASFSYCPDSASQKIKFYTGWSCSDSLMQPFDTTALCQFDTITYIIELESANIGLSDGGARNRPLSEVSYTLCDTLFYECCFKSTQVGQVTLNNIELPNFPANLGVLDLSIRKGYCDSSTAQTWFSITYDTLQANWPITASDMDTIGYKDSVLKVNEGISVRIAYMPDCLFEDTLPSVVLNANSYCNEPLSSTYDFNNTLTRDTTISACHDCFALKKTANDSVIAALDTMSFNIEICANNQDSGFVYIHEYLPPNFVNIDTLPWYIITPAIGCTTLVVNGYFTQSGECNVNENFVQINYAGFDSLNVYFGPDSLLDSACVTVTNACIDPNTIIFLNNDFSHNYLNTYSNASIYVEGLFYVDQDLTLLNCQVRVNAGSQIIITNGAHLTINDSTQIAGCDSMWQGILMEPETVIELNNGSSIHDAHRAIQVDNNCSVFIKNSRFNNNITGIYTAPDSLANMYAIQGFSVTGTTFTFGGSFLPDYLGQPTHGAAPFAGIDLSDVTVNIGDPSTSSNHFLNMNFGIKSFRGIIEVANSDFQNIYSVTGYASKLMGTAIVSVGDVTLGVPGSLSVFPVNSNSNTINKCERGVYASFSDLIVSNCKIVSVSTGVECTQNNHMQSAVITENTILASKYGIRFYDNVGSNLNTISFNQLYISGSSSGVGISILESKYATNSNYRVQYNSPIEILDANTGILASFLNKPIINCNYVKQKHQSGNSPVMTGISINSCKNAQVINNVVKGNTPLNTTRIGIDQRLSTSSLISCNSVDSTGIGIHFGGQNLFTNFRGNYMNTHFEGLHLTNTAIIDTQDFAGNRWFGNYLPWFGAVNLNAANIIVLRKSLFVVNPLDSTYFPRLSQLNPNNTQWFNSQPGIPNYSCPNVNPCSSVEIVNDDNLNLLELIALDSILSMDYINESQSIAQNVLYTHLMENTTLRDTNLILHDFVLNHPVFDYLYQARIRLQEIHSREDTLAIQLLSLDSALKILADSLGYYQQEYTLYSDSTALQNLNKVTTDLHLLKIVYSDLVHQLRLRENSLLMDAGFYNNQITSTDLPIENEVLLNEVQIIFDRYGKDSISSYIDNLLIIAHQCPYQGGESVDKARMFVALFNDSIVYDDLATCLAQGYYRTTNSPTNSISKDAMLTIKPNPAKDFVEITLINAKSDFYTIEIRDVNDQLLYSENKIQCREIKLLNTSIFSSGIYLLKVKEENGNLIHSKLIIVR